MKGNTQDDPRIHACVYVSHGQRIEAKVVDVGLNPIVVMIGGEYSCNTMMLMLGEIEACVLCDALKAAIQDYQTMHKAKESDHV